MCVSCPRLEQGFDGRPVLDPLTFSPSDRVSPQVLSLVEKSPRTVPSPLSCKRDNTIVFLRCLGRRRSSISMCISGVSRLVTPGIRRFCEVPELEFHTGSCVMIPRTRLHRSVLTVFHGSSSPRVSPTWDSKTFRNFFVGERLKTPFKVFHEPVPVQTLGVRVSSYTVKGLVVHLSFRRDSSFACPSHPS